ncbi:alpha/beta fold hydrolase [Parvularcula flava]|uniref:Alpha/beta fold hydrolase n=1 Tax=Aquisalinus luteolus TaxID=1566827 RepID=A0A8J3A764_9PROT|nr:alpha/beta hydrolase [Aquisalinus luteolus]NHK28193.1 alpha/beta fold hydrolase [Aquisalinus luteolus]GGH97744.1 hypothetical protein GCM10011355_19700 [Aquisalinus luteolus]
MIRTVLYLTLCIPTFGLTAVAQDIAAPATQAEAATPPPSPEVLSGYWRGALVQDGSVLNLIVHISENEEGALVAATEIEDWLWYGMGDGDEVSINADGTITIEGLYSGDATLQYDPAFRQMKGTVGTDPVRTLHLKPMPAPPAKRFTDSEVTFTSADGTQLAATLVMPDGPGPHPGLVLVAGRGCSERYEEYGQERLYAEYGIATIVYDKRGAGASEGDCDSFTQADLTADAQAALAFLQAQPQVDPARTGMQGTSAGTWVIQNVAELAQSDPQAPQPAFLVTWIGPATSIMQQQRASAKTFGDMLGLSDAQIDLVYDVLDISVSRTLADEEIYARLQEIETQAEDEGWKGDMFGDTDFASSPETVDALWIRRFEYDPAPMLESLTVTPYLAVFGEDDPVVPYAENVAALKAGLDAAGNTSYRIVGIHGQGHGFEHGNETVTLPDGTYYFKFDTVEPLFFGSAIDFLRENGFAPY